MSEALEFLRAVLPGQGFYCLAKPLNGGAFGHQVFDTIDELATVAQHHSSQQTDIYYAVGSLEKRFVVDDTGKKRVRTHANMLAHKSLFIDLDCGEGKDFATQAVAVTALKSFCKDSGWFKPSFVVNSGRGVHVYWVFDKALKTDLWKQLADRFKSILMHFALKADHACTSDKSRVLRVPGTFNWKDKQNPKPVKVLMNTGARYSVADIQNKIKSIMKAYQIDFNKYERKTVELPENIKKAFVGKISNLQRNAEYNIDPIYEGCAQMARVKEIGGPVGYQMRACAASIIKLTKEQDYSILWENDPDPRKVKNQTEGMIDGTITDNPHRCETFETHHPEGCKGCPSKGRINSPIKLGERRLDFFKEEDVKTYEERNPVEVEDTLPEHKMIEVDGKQYTVVKPPSKYKITPDGQITGTEKMDGDWLDMPVCDFFIVPLMLFKEKSGKSSICIYAKPGKDKGQILHVDAKELATADSLRKVLAAHAIFVDVSDKSTYFHKYMVAYIKHLQKMCSSVTIEPALGWSSDEFDRFVTPECSYTPEGTEETYISSVTKTSIAAFKKKGSLEAWKEVINFYAQPGYEDYAFGHLTAYGSLIFPFSGHSGAIVSIIGDSGSGKSTVLKSINSVFGDPKAFMTKSDTINSQINRLSVYRNYCVTYDEITNIDAAELSNFVYSVSQGRAKMRLNQNAEEKSTQHNNWQLILACTGNSNLSDRLSANKIDASAETLRIFEYYIHRRNTVKHSEAREIFEKTLDHNYGHAGNIFIEYMVKNVDKIRRKFDEIMVLLEQKAGTNQKERFWLAIATANIVGGLVAKQLGLHNFDMNSIFNWVVEKLKDMQGVVDENTRSSAQIISEFINNSTNRVIVLAGGNRDRNGQVTSFTPLVEPNDQLWVRIEKDLNIAYIDRQRLREYLTKGGSDFNKIKNDLIESGALTHWNANKVLSRDSGKTKSGSTKCWMIRLDHKDMAGAVAIPKKETPQTGCIIEGDRVA